MIDFNNKTVFITGGTGSFGKKYVEYLLENFPGISKIVIYSRDEFKQHQFRNSLHKSKIDKVKFIIGDVRDLQRLTMSLRGIDYVVHAAALKHVTAGEENPGEFIKTNIIGAENIIQASIAAGVKRVVAMSTDKAVYPVSLYGATKLCSDKLFIAANDHKGNAETIFCVVRYGNLLGSRGSVLPLFIAKAKEGLIPLTDERMTRFHIDYPAVIKLVMFAITNTLGGEIFIPKLPSFKIIDLAKAVDENCKIEIVGARPGEKLHEELIDEANSSNVLETDDYYIILPANTNYPDQNPLKKYQPVKRNKSFTYSSDKNDQWLNVEELRKIIYSEVNTDFLISV
jgi:UDP-N-acetylglucosamine 4,6-dehydratase